MSVTYKGEQEFVDQCVPAPVKNEFGIDVLSRKMRGRASGLLAFLLTLRQGQQYGRFYLQSWQPDTDPIYPTVTLVYKGLVDGLPDAMINDQTSTQTVTISTSTPSNASRTIQFWAPSTSYRYISLSRPNGFLYSGISNDRNPIVFSSVINDEQGIIYKGNAPAALVTALTPAIVNLQQSQDAQEVYGTPYFEVEEVVIKTYFGG